MLKPYTYDDIIHWRDSSTFETRAALAGVWWKDDFLGRALDTTVWWATNDTGAATEAVVADAPNGVYALALDATNEIQLAGIDFDDHRPFTLNQGLIFECRFRFTVLPDRGLDISTAEHSGRSLCWRSATGPSRRRRSNFCGNTRCKLLFSLEVRQKS